jgi:hypothetical protein
VTERRREGYLLTTDPRRVDVDLVHRWLSEQSYWAKGRDRAVVERSIVGSRNYSVFEDVGYDDARQAAFARAVTDGATFAWVCDVFVDEQHRGKGWARGWWRASSRTSRSPACSDSSSRPEMHTRSIAAAGSRPSRALTAGWRSTSGPPALPCSGSIEGLAYG